MWSTYWIWSAKSEASLLAGKAGVAVSQCYEIAISTTPQCLRRHMRRGYKGVIAYRHKHAPIFDLCSLCKPTVASHSHAPRKVTVHEQCAESKRWSLTTQFVLERLPDLYRLYASDRSLLKSALSSGPLVLIDHFGRSSSAAEGISDRHILTKSLQTSVLCKMFRSESSVIGEG